MVERTIDAWENEGGARLPLGHREVQRPVSHATLLVGGLYAIAIIVVLMIVSRL